MPPREPGIPIALHESIKVPVAARPRHTRCSPQQPPTPKIRTTGHVQAPGVASPLRDPKRRLNARICLLWR